MEEKLSRINNIRVVGKLINVIVKNDKTKDGREYVSAKMEVKVENGAIDRVIELEAFSMKLTKAGAISKLYDDYKSLPNLLNRRVNILGSAKDNVFVSEGSVKRSTRFTARFISEARNTEEDAATFEISGFILSPIKQNVNKEGTVTGYRVGLGQSNYSGTGIESYSLSIEPDNNSAISYFESSVQKNDTFVLRGELIQGVETNEVLISSDFGAPTAKVYQNSFKRLEIKTGNKIEDDTSYLEENITQLLAAQATYEQKLLEDAKSAPTSSSINDQKTLTQKIVQNVL